MRDVLHAGLHGYPRREFCQIGRFDGCFRSIRRPALRSLALNVGRAVAGGSDRDAELIACASGDESGERGAYADVAANLNTRGSPQPS